MRRIAGGTLVAGTVLLAACLDEPLTPQHGAAPSPHARIPRADVLPATEPFVLPGDDFDWTQAFCVENGIVGGGAPSSDPTGLVWTNEDGAGWMLRVVPQSGGIGACGEGRVGGVTRDQLPMEAVLNDTGWEIEVLDSRIGQVTGFAGEHPCGNVSLDGLLPRGGCWIGGVFHEVPLEGNTMVTGGRGRWAWGVLEEGTGDETSWLPFEWEVEAGILTTLSPANCPPPPPGFPATAIREAVGVNDDSRLYNQFCSGTRSVLRENRETGEIESFPGLSATGQADNGDFSCYRLVDVSNPSQPCLVSGSDLNDLSLGDAPRGVTTGISPDGNLVSGNLETTLEDGRVVDLGVVWKIGDGAPPPKGGGGRELVIKVTPSGEVKEGEPVEFTIDLASGEDFEVVSFDLTTGELTLSTDGPTITRPFDNGIHIVKAEATLIVGDNLLVLTATTTVTVAEVPPQMSFEIPWLFYGERRPPRGAQGPYWLIGKPVQIVNGTIYDIDEIREATIDFGDGSGEQPLDLETDAFLKVGFSTEHLYTKLGSSIITIRVTDVDGASTTRTSTVWLAKPQAGVRTLRSVFSTWEWVYGIEISQLATLLDSVIAQLDSDRPGRKNAAIGKLNAFIHVVETLDKVPEEEKQRAIQMARCIIESIEATVPDPQETDKGEKK